MATTFVALRKSGVPQTSDTPTRCTVSSYSYCKAWCWLELVEMRQRDVEIVGHRITRDTADDPGTLAVFDVTDQDLPRPERLSRAGSCCRYFKTPSGLSTGSPKAIKQAVRPCWIFAFLDSATQTPARVHVRFYFLSKLQEKSFLAPTAHLSPAYPFVR